MSTELAVLDNNPKSIIMQDVRNLNFDALQKLLDEEERSFSSFPGDALVFKKGRYRWGFGKDAPVFHENQHDLVMNVANTVIGWRRWDNGKLRYGPMSFPAMGQKLVDRQELGDLDETLWEINPLNNRPKDPWERYAVVPFRIHGDTQNQVNHFMMASWSGVKAVTDLLRLFAKEGRNYDGLLPVITLGVQTLEHWEQKGVTYDVPTFEIKGWVEPVAADVPDGGVSVGGAVSEQKAIESKPVVEAKARVAQKADAFSGIEDGLDGAKKTNETRQVIGNGQRTVSALARRNGSTLEA